MSSVYFCMRGKVTTPYRQQAPIEKIPPDRWCHKQSADILNSESGGFRCVAPHLLLPFTEKKEGKKRSLGIKKKKIVLMMLENLTQLGVYGILLCFLNFFKSPFPLEIACFVKSLLLRDQKRRTCTQMSTCLPWVNDSYGAQGMKQRV